MALEADSHAERRGQETNADESMTEPLPRLQTLQIDKSTFLPSLRNISSYAYTAETWFTDYIIMLRWNAYEILELLINFHHRQAFWTTKLLSSSMVVPL